MVPDYPGLISEGLADLERLERSQRHGLAGDRVRFLRLLKSGQAANVSRAAGLVGYGLRTVQEWWRVYRESGLSTLLRVRRAGGVPEQMTPEAWSGLEVEMRAGRIQRMSDAQRYLDEHWNMNYGLDALYKLCKRRKVKWKTGRLKHRSADTAAQASFKK
ncbi:helix-turn-helix domain-containing protein [Roseateles sp.]|uniref:helix-turn-helix domain-containing protein n=1 Tax=Roseateles sp. TaxID=1971397 RepID=UPI002E029B06|nr:helix-turn-helix domain-containing protein [Roseateles sp.]